jgi:ATP-binding cassette, sub-family E, member 1
MRRERIAVVDREKLKHKPEAIKICADACPINRAGSDCIYERDGSMAIDELLCIGCGICINVCPIPEAIKIVNLPAKLNEDPIHRYDENGFALFSLPTPIFGKVVGILGVNGIGKSTAMKVLAGQIVPNFGKFDKESSYDELVNYFKGTEAQKFFENVRDGKIKISYKPQSVDLIPKQVKGTVKELLMKVDEKNEFQKVVDKLELRHLLERNVDQVSGGELQRIAIAATVLRDANLYIFDEPTSYLDIKQRLKMSEFIKELADAETAVLVVEHDLLILDHMTDLVHIMYGSEDVFGIVSQPRTTRVAMNAYLSGYLKEENVRIRDSKINFEGSLNVEKKTNPLAKWNGIAKKLGNFSLTAPSGEVRKEEVVGVLGENGIGKTSFVKLLAKVEELDEGEIDSKIKVSYKPQYLNTESEELVVNLLSDAMNYENQLIKPLNLEPLYLKKLNQLSGGQLQRVSIAYCLSQDADLFLLDEPSAYLDVEQRLRISKIVRDFMTEKGKSALVVDHDLLFLDFISQRLLVFDGEPAVSGVAEGPFDMKEGMNGFLKKLNISMRRDEESFRPRINKRDSVKDREQKNAGSYYF